jgi:serine/threonine protein kinase
VPGAEPLPGYRLLKPLGRGGFGEVWKCEAPGGLHKAIKFVSRSGDQFRQELAAFEQIKSIRHPYLLMLERVEVTGTELVMVMELADCQLQDRLLACRENGHPGIPRDELLGYLKEAAEALDMIGCRHGLQHLDVKPENLFLVSDHVKLGDYGLVRRADLTEEDDDKRGFTPRYTAPEVLRGQVHPHSDQYSLALVYYELVTGSFPYSGQTAQELMRQHGMAKPNLSELPAAEQEVVGRALAKDPNHRFPSCSAFVKALVHDGAVDRTRDSDGDAAGPTAAPRNREPGTTWTERETSISSPPPQRRPPRRPSRAREEPPPPPDPFAGLQRVMPVETFLASGEAPTLATSLTALGFMETVVRAAVDRLSASPGYIGAVEGPNACRILCTLPAAMVPLKLALVAENWRMEIQHPDPSRIVLWKEAPPDSQKPVKGGSRIIPPRPRTGLEVTLHVPKHPSSEYLAVGRLCGAPDDSFVKLAKTDLPAILEDIRGRIHNLDERRAHPRYPADFAARIFPLYADGVVGEPIEGRCIEVALGGIRLLTTHAVRVERMYIEFPELRGLAHQAIYCRVLRGWQDLEGRGAMTAGRVYID